MSVANAPTAIKVILFPSRAKSVSPVLVMNASAGTDVIKFQRRSLGIMKMIRHPFFAYMIYR